MNQVEEMKTKAENLREITSELEPLHIDDQQLHLLLDIAAELRTIRQEVSNRP